MKTFDRKDVYSWSNAEEAKQYIGEKGYFSDELKKNLKFWVKGTLKVINTDLKVSEVFAKENEEGDYPYGLFIPANKVKEVEEKKWRAFKDIGEFQCVTNKFIGDIIEVKSDWDSRVYRCLIMWATEGYIGMAGLRFSLLIDLFEHYQWKDSNNEWQPFGVLDES